MKGINRLPFSVASHEFDLSNHQPILLLAETKELMPTVIRLAKLMSYAAPPELLTITLGKREEILNAITHFLSFVNKLHFPLHFEHLEAEEENWYGKRYHPWLSQIPVNLVGFAGHDIEPDNYGDLVGLLAHVQVGQMDYFFSRENKLLKKYPSWKNYHSEFRLGQIVEILEGMDLPEPIDGLPSLIRTVLHETDTFYLDACPICPCSGDDFKWTIDNFKWLKADWEEAKPIYNQNQKLIKWSNSSTGSERRNNPEGLKKILRILEKADLIYTFYKDDCPSWF